jgi:predicted nucleic acid-binding protein
MSSSDNRPSRRPRFFADALIGALAQRAGCVKTFTLDRKALRLPGFELL